MPADTPSLRDFRGRVGAFRYAPPLSGLPWPQRLIAVWIGILLIGGPVAAKAGLPGPIYPNEIIIAVAVAAMILHPTLRRERLTAIRSTSLPRSFAASVVVFALAFAVAAVRGYVDYGRLIRWDAGLGYLLLIPLLALIVVRRPEWASEFMRVLYWASLAAAPLVGLEYADPSWSFNPLSLSLGFVALFAVAPMLDDWLRGGRHWIGRLYVLAVPVFMLWKVVSRSAILSLGVGLLVVVVLDVHESWRDSAVWRRLMAVAIGWVVTFAGVWVLVVVVHRLESNGPVSTPVAQSTTTTPAQQTSTNPAKPAATNPAKPAAANPAKPAAANPAKPAATNPAKPAATNPAKPAATTPAASSQPPVVSIVTSTVTFAADTKGNNARWRLDFARELLRRSVRSASDVLLGVGLGKPSRFLWNEAPGLVQAYDFRGTPIPEHVNPNGDISGPHNGFVDVVYRLGWPAGFAVVGLVLFPLVAGLRALRTASRADARWIRVLLATTTAGVIVALTSDALRVPEAAVPFAVSVGILLALVLRRRGDPVT